MKPLKKLVLGGYRNGQWTFYKKRHRGTDWKAYYQNLYAPTDGRIISTPSDSGGGLWVNFRDSNGYTHQFAHMKEVRPKGSYKEGAIIGITGNSGVWTSGPHLHHQIKKNLIYYDPERFGWTEGITVSQAKDLLKAITTLRSDVVAHLKRTDARHAELYKRVGKIEKALKIVADHEPKEHEHEHEEVISVTEEKDSVKEALVTLYDGFMNWIRRKPK